MERRPNCNALRSGGERGAAAPEQRADAGEQHPRLHRLDDIVVGTELQAQHVIDVAVAGRQNENGVGVTQPQLPTDGEPVLPGQAEIQNDEVRRLALHLGEDLVATARDVDSEAVAFEVAAHELRQAQIVLDEQNRRDGSRARPEGRRSRM